MNITRLRTLLRKGGFFGGLYVALCLGGHHLWRQRWFPRAFLAALRHPGQYRKVFMALAFVSVLPMVLGTWYARQQWLNNKQITVVAGGPYPRSALYQQQLNMMLLDASDKRDTEQVRFLLRQGADVNTKDRYGDTPLLEVFHGHMFPHTSMYLLPLENFALVQRLLDAGANANARDCNGQTALMMAAEYGYTDSVRYLLKKGADVNVVAPDCSPDTALALATLSEHSAIIKLLKQAGAKNSLTANALTSTTLVK